MAGLRRGEPKVAAQPSAPTLSGSVWDRKQLPLYARCSCHDHLAQCGPTLLPDCPGLRVGQPVDQLRWQLCQIPRRGGRLIDEKRLELQRLARFLARAIENVYGTISVIYATAHPIDP